jgi:hypothetical protein
MSPDQSLIRAEYVFIVVDEELSCAISSKSSYVEVSLIFDVVWLICVWLSWLLVSSCVSTAMGSTWFIVTPKFSRASSFSSSFKNLVLVSVVLMVWASNSCTTAGSPSRICTNCPACSVMVSPVNCETISISPSVQKMVSPCIWTLLKIWVPRIPIEEDFEFNLNFSGATFPILPVMVLNVPCTKPKLALYCWLASSKI